MSFWNKFKDEIRTIANISDHLDTDAAARSIRGNILFRGPNVWILAFSIVIASVGLNVNSTAVIIGAMLISPLMGPIIGIGLGLGVNDTGLIKDGLKNLLVMVVISLLASFIYFLVSPLRLANPTELLSRTNPTIYDVLIAFFGGAAGILEISRKEKGTVLSGVAIATALMPPLCTAGFGLASLNMRYFLGAIMLFIINGVFIILATYLMSKILGFHEVEFLDQRLEKRTKRLVTAIIVLVMIPSVWSAVNLIRSNTFSQNALKFVTACKTMDKGYLYDYEIETGKGGTVTLYIAGAEPDENELSKLKAKAEECGIDPSKIVCHATSLAPDNDRASNQIVRDIYSRTDYEISKRDALIRSLESQIEEYRSAEIPFMQVSREVSAQYPQVRELMLARGADVALDSLSQQSCLLVVARSDTPLSDSEMERLTGWLQVRLSDSTVVVLNSHK